METTRVNPSSRVDWEQLPSHPRLFADVNRIHTVNSYTDEISRSLRDLLKIEADNFLASERLDYPPTGFLMYPIRQVQGRILTLALIYRLTKHKPYLDRARQELLQLADLSEWRPSHFLDVGEAALAAGV